MITNPPNCLDSSVSKHAQTPSALGVLYAEWLKNNEAIVRADGEFSRTSRTQDDEDRLLTRLFLNEKDIERQIFDAPCNSGFDLAVKCLVALHLHQERLSDVALECIKQDAAQLACMPYIT